MKRRGNYLLKWMLWWSAAVGCAVTAYVSGIYFLFGLVALLCLVAGTVGAIQWLASRNDH